MIERLNILFGGALRRRMTAGMALVVAVTMTLFVIDMTHRQQAAALQQHQVAAAALARSVAASAAVWVASRDYAGLQEIVEGLKSYPDLRHAIVLDPRGLVIAHTEHARRGQTLADLPKEPEPRVMQASATLIDLAEPILLDRHLVGWARIGLGSGTMEADLAAIQRRGLLYALAAIALSILLAQLASRALTRRLDAIVRVADAVQAGETGLRVALSGRDEAARLGHAFDTMLDSLARQQRTLVEFNRNFEAFLDQTTDFVYFKDRASRFVFCSQTLAHITGHAHWKEMIGKHDLEVFPPDTARIYHEEERPVLEEGKPLLQRIDPYYDEAGRPGWVMTSKWPVRDDAGEVVGIFGISRDISEIKRNEETLRQAKAETERLLAESDRLRCVSLNMLEDQRRAEREIRRLSLAVEQSPESVVITNLQAEIEYVNDAFVRATGYGREEAQGKNPRLLQSGKTPRETYDALWSSLWRGETWRGEFINRRKDGEEYIETAIITPLRQPDGAITHYVAVKLEITERRRMEEELARHRHHLEVLVEARTAELEQARRAAEAANRAKSVFLANMSHELRTPLNAILGFAQILERDPSLGGRQRQELGTINRSGQHLLSLINDVLEISRIEAGRTGVQNEPFDLGYTLAAVEEMIRLRAEAKGLGLAVERADGLPSHVLGDAHRLRQVLINLLGNAVKYTDEGQVTLRVFAAGDLAGNQLAQGERTNQGSAELRSASGLAPGTMPEMEDAGAEHSSALPTTIHFEVADTGPGIAPADQGRIFDPFFQTEAGIAKGEGTGLGLAISRQFVHLMGGELTLESALRQGSRFGFAILLPPAKEAPADLRHGRVLGLEPGQPACRVLVAEDHPDNRALILRLLEEMGFEARTVDDGRQVIAAFEEWRPDLILMDMRMPVMDGYVATRRIRELPGGDTVRIVALTASAFQEERDAILAAGCDELVHKPIEGDRLFDVMGKLLGLRFRYEAEEAALASPAGEGDPSAWLRTGLSALSGEVRQTLAQAAEGLDETACLEIAAGLEGIHPEQARLIQGLVREFRFDRVLELCEGGGE